MTQRCRGGRQLYKVTSRLPERKNYRRALRFKLRRMKADWLRGGKKKIRLEQGLANLGTCTTAGT